MSLLLRWCAAVLILVSVTPALAHALPGTSVSLDFHQREVGMEIVLPLDQFELGFKRPVMDDPAHLVERYPQALPAYLRDHIELVASDGRRWRVAIDSLKVDRNLSAGHDDLIAELMLIPPPGAPVRQFRINYSVINHEVMTHNVLVFARSDWQNGVLGAEPQLLGTIRFTITGIDIDRARGSFWTGFSAVFDLGVEHIAEGTDHLLFLLALLLPAPLIRRRDGRWGGYAGTRTTLIRLAKLVTAFTIGHSITLILGAFGNIAIPSKPVEVAIALSIFASALHAWRPLLRGREAWVAAGFGLVHGLAFSQIIAGGGLEGWNKAAAVLGFNLGIEAVQLLVVALVVPWLILLARAGRYTPIRLVGAVFAAITAIGWAIERLTGAANLVSRGAEVTSSIAPILLASLALIAIIVTVRGRLQSAGA